MADTFATPDQYPAIRALVQLGLGPADIPDAVLDMVPFSPTADQFVLLMLEAGNVPMPPGGWPDDPHFVAYQTAADYWCAALVAQGYPSLTSERFDDYAYSRLPLDLTARATWLRAQAQMLLLQALGLPSTAMQPIAFDLALAGTRGDLGI